MAVLFMMQHVAELASINRLLAARAGVEVGGIRHIRRDHRDGIELPAGRAGGLAHQVESHAGRTSSASARRSAM